MDVQVGNVLAAEEAANNGFELIPLRDLRSNHHRRLVVVGAVQPVLVRGQQGFEPEVVAGRRAAAGAGIWTNESAVSRRNLVWFFFLHRPLRWRFRWALAQRLLTGQLLRLRAVRF